MKYVAFLRGINVGGNTMVKMEKLQKVITFIINKLLLKSLSMQQQDTFLQSIQITLLDL